MGGPTSLHYRYDDSYQLVHADGTFKSSPDKLRSYTLDLGYDDIHNIVTKNQVDNLTNAGGSVIPQKATTYNWTYAYAGTPHAPTHIGNRTYSYDADGNQLGWKDDNNGTRRVILWDEENRISEIESPRVLRRLQYPRRWSHEQIKEVFPRSTRTRSPYGAGASR